MKQSVLISNDDGVMSPGLHALADAFLADGWRVVVCAPHQERSAAAHSITIKRPIVASLVLWHDVPEDADLSVYQTDGTPCDCVKLAMHELCGFKPDIVVAGINNGWNVGSDVHYSGTCGAAMEGAFEGAPAIAVSAKRFDDQRNRFAASVTVKLAKRLVVSPLPMPSVLNINVPDCAPEDVKGLVEAPLTCITYTDVFRSMQHSRGRSAHWLSGDIVEEGCKPGGDLDRLLQGYVTMTVLGWDMTAYGLLDDMKLEWAHEF